MSDSALFLLFFISIIIFLYLISKKLLKVRNNIKSGKFGYKTNFVLLVIVTVIDIVVYLAHAKYGKYDYLDLFMCMKFASIPLAALSFFKFLRSLYFAYAPKELIHYSEPDEYYKKGDEYYLRLDFFKLSKTLEWFLLIFSIILLLVTTYVFFKGLMPLKSLYIYFEILLTFYVFMYYLIMYFKDDKEAPLDEKKEDVTVVNNTKLDLYKEYNKWKDSFLGMYFSLKKIKHMIENKTEYELQKTRTLFFEKDDKYDKMFNTVIKGKNTIIESCNITSFTDSIIPIINLFFNAEKKILFLCDSIHTVNDCEKWFKQLKIKDDSYVSNVVLRVFNNNDSSNAMIDGNVDIFIGTVDTILNSQIGYKNIDVVFGINADKFIIDDALNTNILASILASNNDGPVQYVLYANRANSLRQTASSVFLTSDFSYNVIDSMGDTDFEVRLFKSEVEHFQNKIADGYVSNYLGQSIPLSIPALKCNYKDIIVISKNRPYLDQIKYLKLVPNLVKEYICYDNDNAEKIEDLSSRIQLYESENFVDINDNAIVTVEDDSNLALEIANWAKYNKKELYLNVVSFPYLLRDYIAANIDFFVPNVEVIGNILPYPSNSHKLSLYRLINELCYGKMDEEKLLIELNKLSNNTIDISIKNQTKLIIDLLNDLTRKIFGVNIYYDSFLLENVEGTINGRKSYSLINDIKYELPDSLFKTIKFLDLDKNATVLKSIPVYELYQNYLERQIVVINGRSYLIDSIDCRNSIVNLSYVNNTCESIYRQIRNISGIKHEIIVKKFPELIIGNNSIKKQIESCSFIVNTEGYFEFKDNISFETNEYVYHSINNDNKIVRFYNHSNMLKININSSYLKDLDDNNRFRIGFTLSVLINEIFNTIFSDIKQYILVRNVVNNEDIIKNLSNDELVKLYIPIIDKNVNKDDNKDDNKDGITLYFVEDTELEKGIIDSIITNFDSKILPLVYDYLYWLLKEENINDESLSISSNGDGIIISNNIDKEAFLKFGDKSIKKIFDLKGTMKLLSGLILNKQLTEVRERYIKERQERNLSVRKKQNNDSDNNTTNNSDVITKINLDVISNINSENKLVDDNNKIDSSNDDNINNEEINVDFIEDIVNSETFINDEVVNNEITEEGNELFNKVKDVVKYSFKDVIDKLSKNDSNGLYHKTRIANLESIYSTKRLYAVNELKDKGITYYSLSTAENPDTTFDDYVRLFVSKEEVSSKYKRKACVLVIDYKALSDDNTFFINNSSDSSNNDIMEILYEDLNKETEIHVMNNINIKHINRIIFRTEDEMNSFKEENKDWDIPVEVDESYFN